MKNAAYPFLLLGMFLQSTVSGAERVASSSYDEKYITVEKDVNLQVVDWGGSGRALVFIGGLGADAHVFDHFALNFVPKYHVYGVTRRGFGKSSSPASGYNGNRLGDDIVSVIESLGLDRPILVGHSMGGMELSSVGSRHPDKVSALVYLEAAYSYAYYDRSSGDTMNVILDSLELRKLLEQMLPGKGRPDQKRLTDEILEGVIQLEKELMDRRELLKRMPEPPPESHQEAESRIPVPIQGIYEGLQKYTKLTVPILAIYSVPHALDDMGDADSLAKDPAAAAKLEAEDTARVGSQANAFEKGVPSARVVRLPHASHFIFNSDEADVVREMNDFLGKLR
jgi:non-heme chloroperoxidase